MPATLRCQALRAVRISTGHAGPRARQWRSTLRPSTHGQAQVQHHRVVALGRAGKGGGGAMRAATSTANPAPSSAARSCAARCGVVFDRQDPHDCLLSFLVRCSPAASIFELCDSSSSVAGVDFSAPACCRCPAATQSRSTGGGACHAPAQSARLALKAGAQTGQDVLNALNAIAGNHMVGDCASSWPVAAP